MTECQYRTVYLPNGNRSRIEIRWCATHNKPKGKCDERPSED
jgi:hypothetical protein